jgi:hypothetical protein
MPVIVSDGVHFGNESLVVASEPATCPEMDIEATGADSIPGMALRVIASIYVYFHSLK